MRFLVWRFVGRIAEADYGGSEHPHSNWEEDDGQDPFHLGHSHIDFGRKALGTRRLSESKRDEPHDEEHRPENTGQHCSQLAHRTQCTGGQIR